MKREWDDKVGIRSPKSRKWGEGMASWYATPVGSRWQYFQPFPSIPHCGRDRGCTIRLYVDDFDIRSAVISSLDWNNERNGQRASTPFEPFVYQLLVGISVFSTSFWTRGNVIKIAVCIFWPRIQPECTCGVFWFPCVHACKCRR